MQGGGAGGDAAWEKMETPVVRRNLSWGVRRRRPEGRERSPSVLLETNPRVWLRRFARSAVCVLAAAAVPRASGGSVTTTPLPNTMPNLASADGKSKGLLTSLEALFKKNCELLGKLRVELNDFSDGLDSLRELADSKLKGTFAAESLANESASTLESRVTPSEQPSEPVQADHRAVVHKDNEANDPRFDRKGLRASNHMERGEQLTAPQMKHLRRHGSMDEIVLTEEDELGTLKYIEYVVYT